MLAQEVIREIPERAGIRIVPVGDRKAQEAVMGDRRLWHPFKALDVLIEHIPGWARESLAAIEGELGGGGGRTVLLAGGLAFGARVASERWGLPLITVHLQPSLFMSAEEPPVGMAGMEWLTRMPMWVRRAFFGLAHFQIDRKLKGPVNRLRREAGISGGGVMGIMKHYWHSPDGVLCVFPEWFARKAADWPEQAVLTRFPLYDEAGERPLDAEVEAFLEGGEKPVVITPGSANSQAGAFLKEAVEACRLMKRRGMVLTRFPEQVPADLPEGVKAFEYVPFSRVFPRAAVAVHHGGIGTMAQCFAAGVPQLVMPMAHDQPDNAWRIRGLGVGDYLYPKRFRREAVAGKILGLLGSAKVAEACERVRGLMRGQMGAEAVAAVVEEMAERGLRQREG